MQLANKKRSSLDALLLEKSTLKLGLLYSYLSIVVDLLLVLVVMFLKPMR